MSRAQRIARALPLALALAGVAGVWLAGAVWSFDEQTRYAASRGFSVPWLLPLVLDGLALALAGVAYVAALDGRAAAQARVMTAVAVAASAASNGAWAWARTGADAGAVVLAVGVPVAANLAFEVLLSELRRHVHRRRGLPVPAPIPMPRLWRFAMAPLPALREWRSLVLDATAPPKLARSWPPSPAVAVASAAPASARPARPRAIARVSQREELGELLAVGRELTAALAQDGRTLTRRALTAAIRARGRSLSNERAGQLLAQLRGATPTEGES